MAKNNTTIIIVLAVLALAFFGMPRLADGGGGADPTSASLGEGDDSTAIKVFFANQDKEEVTIDSRDGDLQSTVEFEGGVPTGGIFFMRFDIGADNQGTLDKTMSIVNLEIQDASGVSVEDSIVTSGFSCILNKPRLVTSGGSTTWDTDPDNPATGCSSLSWVPTLVFEDELQPLKIVADIKSEFTLFGISREDIIRKEFTVSITQDSGSFGAVLVNIQSGSSGFIEECDGTIPETELCPLQVGVCSTVAQTCTVDGLWPGCPDSIYGVDYTPGKESNGNGVSDFRTTCKDGLDNDCDGFTDKTNADGTCPSGACDNDCPFAIVDFRTNADFLNGESVSDLEQQGVWVSVPVDPTGLLRSYGYATTRDVTGTQCTSLVPGGSGAGSDTVTPGGGFFVILGSANSKANIYYDPDGNPVTGCKVMEFSSSDTDRCKVGDTFYPTCISRFPADIPFGLNNQETRVDY